jgi:hypothetical protein
LNTLPPDYETGALPGELIRQKKGTNALRTLIRHEQVSVKRTKRFFWCLTMSNSTACPFTPTQMRGTWPTNQSATKRNNKSSLLGRFIVSLWVLGSSGHLPLLPWFGREVLALPVSLVFWFLIQAISLAGTETYVGRRNLTFRT